MASNQICHKIVLIGNSSVGKTSIITQFIYGSTSSEHQPTVGIDFFSKTIQKDGQFVRLQIWDTAGQEKFHSLIPSYIRTSTVAIFVFDITSRTSFEELEKWYNMVTDLANPTLIFVANKVDLEEERCVSTEEGKKLAESHKAAYFETSARTPINITELFEYVAQQPLQSPKETKDKQTHENETETPKTVEIRTHEPPAQGGCGC
ncbi:Ras family protein [Histomonas meleagridis]|uniref:Ras family protein n=1 Tax=Histomonas meleagridis TaxID=135588 RepID=UPI003559C4DB|nr:Ras family protein [Histomonas meleagridis]KAH0800539.1 Ras family protein [Histomonas meleagridis]